MGKGINTGVAEEAPIVPLGSGELPSEFAMADRLSHIPIFFIAGLMTHSCMAYTLLYLIPFGYISLGTCCWFVFLYGYVTGLGITVGCHRYWTHKTFKANKPLQVLLMLMQTAAFQHTIFKWCRDHRVHHKYTDTNADPHSAARGFWFSHITWLFSPRHPDLVESFKTIEISDLLNDPIVRFQSKYYWTLFLLVFFAVPMSALYFLYPEMSLFHIFVLNMTRYGVSLHFTLLVNSVAHLWGDKPYDKYITATDNKFVSILAAGEGWHNYHHTFPWDYKAAEFGYRYNLSTVFIHFFATIGWAWDLKTVSQKLLVDRINRTGDGKHPLYNHDNSDTSEGASVPAPNTYWGWGDKAMREEDMEITQTVFQKSRNF